MPDLSVAIVLAARDLASGTIDGVRGSIESMTGAAGRSNSALAGIMQGVELGAGIAAFGELSGAIEGVATSAVKFQTALTELQNNTTLKPENMKAVSAVILELGNTYGVAQDQIVAGYRHVVDIVQDATASQIILNEAVEGAAASGAKAGDVANVLAAVMREYGTDVMRASDGTIDLVKTHDNAAHTLGVMTAAAQDANSTLDQWTGSLSAAIGIAAAGNQPLENIGAIFGSLTLHGFPDAALAGVQVKDMLIQLAHLTPAATEELARLGKTSGIDVVNDLKLMNEGNMTLVDFLGKLRDAYQKVGLSEADFRVESEKLIAGQRGGLGLNALLTTGYTDMLRIQGDLSDQTRVNTVVDDTWNRTKETAGKQWDILTTQVSNFGITLGSELLPSLTPIIKAMNDNLPEALAAVRSGISTAGQVITDFGHGISEVASPALQFLADRLADAGAAFAPWAAQAGSAGVAVDKSLSATSEVVQALQYLLQGNFKGAWADAQKAVGDFGGELSAIRQVIDDNKNLILAAGAAFGTWAILGTVVPAIVGTVAAVAELAGGFAAWMAVMGPAEGALGAIVALMGGPVTLAIAGVALAVGGLTLAWANNWGDIQGKTTAAVGEVKSTLDELGTELHLIGTKTAELNADINAGLDPINDNIRIKLNRWNESYKQNALDNSAAVKAGLTDLGNTVKTGLDGIDTTVNSWQLGIHNSIVDAFSDSGIAAQIQTLGRTIDAALQPITKAMLDWQAQIKAAVGGAVSSAGQTFGIDTPSAAGGPGGIPNMTGAAMRPSQFSDPQLTADEAMAACGPAALVAFMRSSGGRVPTLREAATIANTPQVGGWNTDVGMATGISGERNLLSAYGLSSQMNQSPTETQIQAGANSGQGEIIDTLHHFFTAGGYDASTGKYNVGTSGSDLKGGSAEMTLAEMTGLMGSVTGILTDIKANTGATAASTDAVAKAGGSGSKEDLIAYARGSAERSGIDPDVFQRQIQQESGFDPNARSGAGAVGIAQFMPGTAKSLGVDPSDSLASLDAAAKYDADLLQKYGGSWQKTLEAYNAGEGHVASGAPDSKETADYLKIILGGSNATGSFASPGGATNSRGAVMQQSAGGSSYLDGAAKTSPLDDLLATQSIDWAKTLQTETNRLAKAILDEKTKLEKADADAGRATVKVDTDAGRAIADVGTARSVSDDLIQSKDAQAQIMQDDKVRNDTEVAAQELIHSRGLQNEQIAHSRALEDTQIRAQQALAAQALVHTRTLQDTEIQYQHSLQLEATAHAQKLEDAKIVRDQLLQDQATQHARTLQDQQIVRDEQLRNDATAHQQQLAQEQTLLNARLANAQLVHQRALQDAALPVDEGLKDTATAHGRSLQDAQSAYDAEKAQQRDAAAYQLQLSQATSDAQRQQLATSHDQTLKNMTLQAQYAAEDLAHRRAMEDEEAKYQEGLQVAALARSRAAQDAEIKYQAGIVDQQSAAANARADTEAQYQRGLAQAALAVSRTNADTETAYQRGLQQTALEQSRADARVEQDYRDGLARTALEHSRTLQDAEIAYQNDQAAKALAIKRGLEDAALADQRTKEDAAIKHRLEMEAAARAFAAAEKTKQEAFDRAQADEADKRAIAKIQADAARAKQDIADRLIVQKQAILEASRTQIDAQKTAFDESAAVIIEKSRLAVTKAGGDFGPIEDTMKASVATMDTAFATAHDNSSKALAELAAQTLANLSTKGTIPTAITDTARVVTQQFGVSDKAVELFGQQFGLSWDVARPLLGNIEQGIYTNLGENGLIPNHIKVSNEKVIAFAKQWGVSWPEAAAILTTESGRIKATFGEGGEVPSAMAASGTAAHDLNTAIQSIQDKTIKVVTQFSSEGSPTSGGARPGAVGDNSGDSNTGPTVHGSVGMGQDTGGGGDQFSTYAGRQAYRDSHPGTIVDASGAYTPPGHAEGGTVEAGKIYTIGEKGPETFVSGSSGYVFPNGANMGSSGSGSGGSGFTPEQMRQLADLIGEAVARRVPTEIGIGTLQSSLLQLDRRGGKITRR